MGEKELHIPPPVIEWSRWDTLATIGLLLAVWFLFSYIVDIPDDEGGS
jgi:hypothetical protein